MPLRPDAGWAPDLDAAPDAAALYLNYPSNPCAVCAPPGTFESAVRWAQRTGGAVVHDAAYMDSSTTAARRRAFSRRQARRTSASRCGRCRRRTAWPAGASGSSLGNAEIVERINLLNDHNRVGIFAPVQAATIAALEGPQDSVAERVDAYERRRDVIAAALPEPIVCEGTFFVWMRLPGGTDSGAAAARAPRRGRAGRGLRPERRGLGAALARRLATRRSSSARSGCSSAFAAVAA